MEQTLIIQKQGYQVRLVQIGKVFVKFVWTMVFALDTIVLLMLLMSLKDDGKMLFNFLVG